MTSMKKRTKWVLIPVGILALLAIGVLIAGSIIRGKIEKELTDTQLGNFRFTCEQVRVNLFRESIVLKGVSLKTEERSVSPDSLLNTPVQYLDAQIEKVSLRGISLKKLKNKDFDFSSLVIDTPNAVIVTHLPAKDSISVNTPEKEQSTWDGLGVGSIRILNGSCDWRRITETDTLQYRLLGFDADIEELRIDSTSQSRSRFLFSKNINVNIRAFRYTFANRAYILALDSLQWNGADKTIAIANTELMPQFSKRDFPRKSVRKSDYMQLDVKKLSVIGIDTDKLWNEGTLAADSAHLASGNFVSFKDRNAVVPLRVKPMMHTTIQRLGIPVDVRKMKVENFNATYEEQALNRTTAGQVTFEHIDATFYGFTNIVKRENQYIELYATARLMGQGELHAVVSMPVDSTNNHFDVKATLLSTSLPTLNRMILPLTGLEIKSGVVDRMDFHMGGSDISANVNMTLRYKDLKIELLKMRRGEWKERDGLSNLANWALIKSENPDKKGLRNAQATVRRDPHRSVYNYIWKGISAGAVETAETGTARRLLGR